MSRLRVVVIGGGAAGFFSAITCAETHPEVEVTVLEKAPQFLAKVRISGGGRCNVTHACFDSREFVARYPRGGRALISPFQRFHARSTVEWFGARGVKLKTEADGRMFPVTDSSQTIIDCLMESARTSGVKLRSNLGVQSVRRLPGGGFDITLSNGETLPCDRLILATGGCRSAAGGALAVSLGHTLELPVPSLFTFHVSAPWVHALAGTSVENAEVSVAGLGLRERGAVLLTHWGLSGPAVLRLSAWGARELHQCNYQFLLLVKWLPGFTAEDLEAQFQIRRTHHPARFVVNTPLAPLTARLWEQLVLQAGLARETRWADASRGALIRLAHQLIRSEFSVTGKSLNKDEFVTCGGVRLKEVNFKSLESRLCPGLFLVGELLDIDGITGGFNFQSAWTTGWLAGLAAGVPVGVQPQGGG